MAPAGGAASKAKAPGARQRTNALHKKRRAERDLPKTNKRTAKNRLRDLGRLLRKKTAQGAPAAELAALETEIAALDGSAAAAAAERKRADRERRYAERYRKVKFFEKQKVRRRLKKLRKSAAAPPSAADAAALAELRDDLRYIEHYPKDRARPASPRGAPRAVTTRPSPVQASTSASSATAAAPRPTRNTRRNAPRSARSRSRTRAQPRPPRPPRVTAATTTRTRPTRTRPTRPTRTPARPTRTTPTTPTTPTAAVRRAATSSYRANRRPASSTGGRPGIRVAVVVS